MFRTAVSRTAFPRFTPRCIRIGILALASAFGTLPREAAAEDRPWQLNLSIAASRGFLTLGRDFGLHYVGAGLAGIAYSSRDGLVIAPGISYQRRFGERYLPYVGVAAQAAYGAEEGWETPIALPTLGYEWRFRRVYLHGEVYGATPLGPGLGRDWGLGAGAGVGVPF
jgi:hypothetical protein